LNAREHLANQAAYGRIVRGHERNVRKRFVFLTLREAKARLLADLAEDGKLSFEKDSQER
jgi:hypothetical protein